MDETQAIVLSDDSSDEGEKREDKKQVAVLRILSQKGYPQTDLPVYEGQNIIGRHADGVVTTHNVLCIPFVSISKAHAVIEVENGLHLLSDNNSRNTTKRGEVKLKPNVQYELSDGCTVYFADIECKYMVKNDEDSDDGSETGSESMLCDRVPVLQNNANAAPSVTAAAVTSEARRGLPTDRGTLAYVSDSEDEERPCRAAASTSTVSVAAELSVGASNISIVKETPASNRVIARGGGETSLVSETIMYTSDQDDDDVESLANTTHNSPPADLVSETVRYESDNDGEKESCVSAPPPGTTSNKQADVDVYDGPTQNYADFEDEESNSLPTSYKSYDAPTQTYQEKPAAKTVATRPKQSRDSVWAAATQKATRLSSAAAATSDWLNAATQPVVADARNGRLSNVCYDDSTDEDESEKESWKNGVAPAKTTDGKFDEPTQAFLPCDDVTPNAKHVALTSTDGATAKGSPLQTAAASKFDEPTQAFLPGDVTPTKHMAHMSAGGAVSKTKTETVESTFGDPTQAFSILDRSGGMLSAKCTARLFMGGDRAVMTSQHSKDSGQPLSAARNIFEEATQNFMFADAADRSSNKAGGPSTRQPSTLHEMPTQVLQSDDEADQTDNEGDDTQVINDDEFANALRVVASSESTIYDDPTQAFLPSTNVFASKPVVPSQSSSIASTQLVEISPKKSQKDQSAIEKAKSLQVAESVSKKTADSTVNHDSDCEMQHDDHDSDADERDESTTKGAKTVATKRGRKRGTSQSAAGRGGGRGRGRGKSSNDSADMFPNRSENESELHLNGDRHTANEDLADGFAKGRGGRGGTKQVISVRVRRKVGWLKREEEQDDRRDLMEVSLHNADSVDGETAHLQPSGTDNQDDHHLLATQAYAKTTPQKRGSGKRGRGRGRGRGNSSSSTPEIGNSHNVNGVTHSPARIDNQDEDLFGNDDDHFVATQAYALYSPAKVSRGGRGGKARGRGRGRGRGKANRSITCSMSEEEETAAKETTKKTADTNEDEASTSTGKRSALKQATPDSKANAAVTAKKRVSYNMSESSGDEGDIAAKTLKPSKRAKKKKVAVIESDTHSDSDLKTVVVPSPVHGGLKLTAGAASLVCSPVSVVLSRIPSSPMVTAATGIAEKQQREAIVTSDNDRDNMDSNNNSQKASTADSAADTADSLVLNNEALASGNGESKEADTQSHTPSKRGRKKAGAATNGVPSKRRSVDSATARIMSTVIELTSADERALANIGALTTNSVFDCTHLVTDKVRRTSKFLSALACGIPIVDKTWIAACKKAGKIVDATPFIIHDEDSEARFQFSLEASLEQARREKMLDGWSVFFTSNVQPNRDLFGDVVTCSGGQVLKKLPVRSSGRVVVISCEQDRAECAAALKAGIPVVSGELLLTGVLQQQRDIAKYQLFAAGSAPNSPVDGSKVIATAARPKAK